MHILITGGSGFLGARLARTLLARGGVSRGGAAAQAITRITLADRAPPPADLAADARVQFVGGDLNEQLASGQIPAAETALVFHLAAAVSGECEADFDLGMRSNYEATRALLEACRALGTRPTFVFASSLAVFGKQPGRPLPDPITDDTLPTPASANCAGRYVSRKSLAVSGTSTTSLMALLPSRKAGALAATRCGPGARRRPPAPSRRPRSSSGSACRPGSGSGRASPP